MSTVTSMSIMLRPALVSAFMGGAWWISNLIKRRIPEGRVKDALYRKRRAAVTTVEFWEKREREKLRKLVFGAK